MKYGKSVFYVMKKLVKPDWVGWQNQHNHLVVEEAFSRADPEGQKLDLLKRKNSDFEHYLGLRRHFPRFRR